MLYPNDRTRLATDRVGEPIYPIDDTLQLVVCTENLIRVDEVKESPKLAE